VVFGEKLELVRGASKSSRGRSHGDESTKDRTRAGIHPSNGISVGGYQEVEMRRNLDGRGGAIRIYGIGTVCALIRFRGPLSPHEFFEIVRFADRSKSRTDLNSRFVRWPEKYVEALVRSATTTRPCLSRCGGEAGMGADR